MLFFANRYGALLLTLHTMWRPNFYRTGLSSSYSSQHAALATFHRSDTHPPTHAVCTETDTEGHQKQRGLLFKVPPKTCVCTYMLCGMHEQKSRPSINASSGATPMRLNCAAWTKLHRYLKTSAIPNS